MRSGTRSVTELTGMVRMARRRTPSGLGRGPAPAPPAMPWRLAALALAIVPPLAQIAHMLATERWWWPQHYEDDAFYYFGVARSLADGDGSTFTGLVPTNGYQPLWQAVLVPLAAVLRSPQRMVAGVMLVQSALWIGAVREALRIGRRVGSEAAAAAGVAALGLLGVLTGRLSFNGMESAPLIFLLLLALRIGMEADDDDPGAERRFGLVLALICLTRLDAALTAVPLGLVMLRRRSPGMPRSLPPSGSPELSGSPGPSGAPLARRVLRLGGPAGVSLLAYAAVNVVVFGSALPVSGRAKGLGAPFLNLEPARQLLQAGEALGRPIWFGAATLLMLAGTWWSGHWRQTDPGRRLMGFTLAFAAGQLLLVACLVVATSYPVWPWYHYDLALIAFGSVLLLASWVSDRTGLAGPAGARAGLAVAAAFLVAQVAVTFYPEDPAYAHSVPAAQFVRDGLPGDVVLAMGDRAGIFGYLADRPLLHLEGLVADAEYLGDMADGTATERMAAEGVDYYVRYGGRGERSTPNGADGWTFEEPRHGHGPRFRVNVLAGDLVFRRGAGDEELTIWRFRPEINGERPAPVR